MKKSEKHSVIEKYLRSGNTSKIAAEHYKIVYDYCSKNFSTDKRFEFGKFKLNPNIRAILRSFCPRFRGD